jgi:sirohydrochlorin ferrochelatase
MQRLLLVAHGVRHGVLMQNFEDHAAVMRVVIFESGQAENGRPDIALGGPRYRFGLRVLQ